MKCPSCNANVPDGEILCPECGTNVVNPTLVTLVYDPESDPNFSHQENTAGAEPEAAELTEENVSSTTQPADGPYLELVGTEKIRSLDNIAGLVVGRLNNSSTTWDLELDTAAPEPARISRSHCIFTRANGWNITDLGSTNGTWLNSQKLAPGQLVPIKDGDIIKLAVGTRGETWLKFHV